MVADEVMNYLQTTLCIDTTHKIGEALIYYILCKQALTYFIYGQDQSFLPSIRQYSYKILCIKIKEICPYVHG